MNVSSRMYSLAQRIPTRKLVRLVLIIVALLVFGTLRYLCSMVHDAMQTSTMTSQPQTTPFLTTRLLTGNESSEHRRRTAAGNVRTTRIREMAGFNKYLAHNDLSVERRRRTNCLKMLSDDDERTTIEKPWPDTQRQLDECGKLPDSYYRSLGKLPTASVIITFHRGETWYNLLHTLHSIFQRTPAELLHEVVLIDDFSDKDEFADSLEQYLKSAFGQKVKLYRNEVNLGLIRSRLNGIRLSSGDVVIVMDSHSEVQPRWIEPLLFEIKKNRRTLANCQIDWAHRHGGLNRYVYSGAGWTVNFDWTLAFGWQNLISPEFLSNLPITEPIRIKVNIGTFAAIDRKFFEEIGAFDNDMELWGGENIDLSIRTWLFGGRVITAPCSRAAHRETPGSRDYRDNFTDVINRNYKRIVDVWFDEYSEIFYRYNPHIARIDAGDLTSRNEIKSRAHFNFSWFLRNVFPELGLPNVDNFAWGKVKNVGSGLCMHFYGSFILYTCVSEEASAANQIFFWSDRFELRREVHTLRASSSPKRRGEEEDTRDVIVEGYIQHYGSDRAVKWIHWKHGPLMEMSSRLCLEADDDGKPIFMSRCDLERHSQMWAFERYSAEYEHMMVDGKIKHERYRELSNQLHQLLRRKMSSQNA